jgi:hypothetical protein
VVSAGLRPVARVALVIAALAAVLWAGIVLVGRGAVVGAAGGVTGVALAVLVTDRPARARERAGRAAVREHRDPGPDLRSEADAQARTILAASAIDRWGPAVVLLGLAVACGVVAFLRDDLPVALPAAPLLVLAIAAVVLRRRADDAADRWLADPPVPADDRADR